MKLAIMQPYFFPYIGYFQLLNAADRFIVADEVQYIRHGWINRNRVLKNDKGTQYIIAPVQKHHLKDTIKEIFTIDDDGWKREIRNKLSIYRKKAPYYFDVLSVLEECFSNKERSICRLNSFYLTTICQYLNIEKNIEILSDLEVDLSNIQTKEDRIFRICNHCGASQYINSEGGIHLYDKNRFLEKNLQLSFLFSKTKPYTQFGNDFEKNLSILDVMMFNSPGEIKDMLKQFELI